MPVTAPQVDVPAATHVAFAESVTPAGSASVTVTLIASDTPVLVTVTVYVRRAARRVRRAAVGLDHRQRDVARSASLSEPLAVLPLVVSTAVAVLISGFVVRPAANATGTVNTRVFAPPASTRAFSAPKLVCPVVPLTVPQVDVPFAVHDRVARQRDAGGQRIGNRHVRRVGQAGVATVTV